MPVSPPVASALTIAPSSELAALATARHKRQPVVRPMSCAGVFYPAEPGAYAGAIGTLSARVRGLAERPYKAMILPHAGLAYCGPIAITGYRSISHALTVKRVVLLSPAHRLAFTGMAVPDAEAFDTPFGPLLVDLEGLAQARRLPSVTLLDAAFDREHGVEAHFPLIRRYLPNASVVPVVLGAVSRQAILDFLNWMWGGPETLVIISSDLSHYLDGTAARAQDDTTAGLIERLESTGLTGQHACGFRGIGALVEQARALDLRPLRLDLRHSGDVTGKEDRVVGYAAYGFEPAESATLTPALAQELLKVARQALRYAVARGRAPEVALETFPEALRTHMRSFVTLEKAGQLRGCIGSYEPINPLIRDVVNNAWKAGFRDPRFKPVTSDELADLSLSISLLSTPRRMAVDSERALIEALVPGRDGLILAGDGKRAIFLPKVWSSLPDPRVFVCQLKLKAGLAADQWPADMKAYRYVAETVGQA